MLLGFWVFKYMGMTSKKKKKKSTNLFILMKNNPWYKIVAENEERY